MGEAIARGAEKRVMVAIDESECSHYALMWVLDNLKDSITKSPLIIFTAQTPSAGNVIFSASLGSARQEFVNSSQENHRKFALGLLEKAKEICANHGVNAETVTEVGDPKAAICDAVQKHNINLLILGERGLGKIKRAILGSVSNYCVQNAKCPVLVVKKSQAEGEVA
ncbi:universal stress protein A-like protein [Pyrus ussuriensis x Pyrus communis]|uniref:Universal stress protein A-like protein n=1 Tax=Pyrus ussuriensis x Pyrus communis TaxID=2448454 RepID=A0A5N5HFN2_9ROSA|nr:universal stress protein A-like protein [Pyrus ussuriensis x Pyrus communis]